MCVSKFSEVQQLLKVSFAHGSSQDSGSVHLKDCYLLLLSVDVLASQSGWTGRTVKVHASVETTINLLELQASSDGGWGLRSEWVGYWRAPWQGSSASITEEDEK